MPKKDRNFRMPDADALRSILGIGRPSPILKPPLRPRPLEQKLAPEFPLLPLRAAGGVIGEPRVTELDTWRLEFTSATSLTLVATGDGGGIITINGDLVNFTSNPTLSNSGLSASTLYRIYAFKSGTTVALEASTTAADKEFYGSYGEKSGDATRRIVGLIFTNASSQFTSDMVRSNENELGYAQSKNITATAVTTTSTSYVDISSEFSMFGLFWNQDLVHTWGNVLNALTTANTTRLTVAAMNFDGSDILSGEVGAAISNSNQGEVIRAHLHPIGYARATSSGRKEVKARFRTASTFTAEVFSTTNQINSMGFEVV